MHVRSARRSALAALLLLAPFAGRASATDTISFSEGWFGPNWTSTKILDTTPGAGATFSSVTNFFDGLPVPCRETTHNFDSGAIVVAHVDSNSTYDPSTGAICSIDGAYDLIHYTQPNGAVRYRLLIVQNGTYYHDVSGTDVFPNLWASYVVNGLTSASFVRVAGSGPERPDFSCAGAPMTFGFTSSNSASSGPNTKVSALDNWLLTLTIARATHLEENFQGPWSAQKIYDSTPGQAATVSVAAPFSGGVTGGYRQITHTLANGAMAVAHVDPVYQHDPAVRPVYSVSCSYALNHFTPSLGAMRFHLLIVQNGEYFVGPWDDVYANAWGSVQHTDLLATDFDNYFGWAPFHPDFTAGGAPFQMGILTSNSVNGGPVTKVGGIDDWRVVLELSPRCGDDVGTAFCFGDNSFLACPCFPSVPPGAPGHGCPNSLFPSGAKLVAQGNPSIGNDSLVLRASGMPNSSCLYFQGTAQVTAGFLDGLRCAGGTVIRLGTQNNIRNASEHPTSLDLPISVQGSVPPGAVRTYQAWYRNAAAFCTSATANLTNGVVIQWTL